MSAEHLWQAMGPLERKLWESLGKRILLGQKRYGKVTLRKKRWRKELYEELLDACFYGMMEIMKHSGR